MLPEVKKGIALIRKATDPLQRTERRRALQEALDEIGAILSEALGLEEAKAKSAKPPSRKTTKK